VADFRAMSAPLSPVNSGSAAPEAIEPVPAIGVLRALLLGEAALGLALAVFFSMLAVALRDAFGGNEEPLRFAASGAFIFAIAAAIASRGARRRRGWAWTLAAILQLVLAIGTGIAVMLADWHPAYFIGFALAAVVMLVLSTSSVRSALGKH
jgi:hypothetical protein